MKVCPICKGNHTKAKCPYTPLYYFIKTLGRLTPMLTRLPSNDALQV